MKPLAEDVPVIFMYLCINEADLTQVTCVLE